MTFTVSGLLDGVRLEVSWTDGELGGDGFAIARVQELVAAGETVWATPTGPHFTAALDPAATALVTLVSVFDSELEVAGEVPDVPDTELPPGAIA